MNQVIVVEGKNDYSKIKEVYKDAVIVTTNGREISQDTLNLIKKYSIDNEIILFLDPDSPGEQIRKKILEAVPNASNAFLIKKEGISKNKKKVGIEHASNEAIKNALSNIYRSEKTEANISMSDLYNLKLIGLENSKELRNYISDKLNIGRPNAKTFLNRINSFNIDINMIKELIKEYDNGRS